jgi:CubicO group peptidase (beta-lactamase class C family)
MTSSSRSHRRFLVIAVLLTLLPAADSAADAQPRPLRGLDSYVTKAVADWGVPGLSIAVVHGDSIVFAKGYGVRELGTGDAVDEHTLFAVGSTTKAMTVVALGMLVDSGRVAWDDPVGRHLPRFRLIDPAVTAQTTIRDMLSHRSGLGTVDRIWYGAGGTVADVVGRLRHQPLASSPRSRYAYQNAMYAAAGAVVESASGVPWDRFVRERIFAPVGMTNARTSVVGLDTAANVATPHDVIADTLRPVAHRNLDNIAPAGAVYAGARDMANWMRFLLDSGRVGGRRLLSDAAWREMLTPQFLVPRSSFYPTASLTKPHFAAYGLGWFLQDYRGELVAMHTGSIDGMVAILGLLPERDVGVVVLANRDHAELRHALMWRVFDAYLGFPARDWSAELRALYDSLAARGRAAAAQREQRVSGTRPSLSLEGYAGAYADSLYGALAVRHDGGRLTIDFGPGRMADLEHWHYDTFRATWRDPELGRSFATFNLGRDGTVRELVLDGYGRLERSR